MRKPKHIYLTVDLDYWNLTGEPDLPFLHVVLALPAEFIAVDHHHHILPHINQAQVSEKATHLINLDFHSDLAVDDDWQTNPQPKPLDCGNWVNQVAWRQRGHFNWRMPAICCAADEGHYNRRDALGRFIPTFGEGVCHEPTDPSPFSRQLKTTGWAKTSRSVGLLSKPELSQVRWVALCQSPRHTDYPTETLWTELLQKYGIPYLQQPE